MMKNRILGRDGRLLFATRSLRLFAYGFLSVVLMLYLSQLGLDGARIGLLFTLALLGDTAVSLWITTAADRAGRRNMLVGGALLMALAGGIFAATDSFALLLLAATIGVISPSGNEVGPFLSIEQAAISQIVPDTERTRVFAWYNLAGSFATALGALSGGLLTQALRWSGVSELGSYRAVVVAYAGAGLLLALLFTRVSGSVEAARTDVSTGASDIKRFLGLHKSRRVVFRLSALFSLDAFGGGFVLQSMMAYWFHVRYNAQPALLGGIFFGANILAGLSSLMAARVARRIGLVRTMVFTHIPSNLLLMLVPLMPNLPLAVAVLLLRFSISQMDVPTRQSYTMSIISPDERSAAAGITGVARTTGASISPMLAGPLLAVPALISVPFFLSGGLKIIYDLLLYHDFRNLRPPEEGEGR